MFTASTIRLQHVLTWLQYFLTVIMDKYPSHARVLPSRKRDSWLFMEIVDQLCRD